MSQHFKLTSREFDDNNAIFSILEIKAEQVVDKNYQDLSKFLKKQHSKLILVNHPDKGGVKSRFYKIHKAYQELKKYIEPLELGNPCVKVSIDAESDGRLTEREFHYRDKLFTKLNITKEEVVKKDFEELISILKNKDHSFERDLKDYNKLKSQIIKKSQDLEKLGMQLFSYITPLKYKESLISEDKKALALKFIERKNILLTIQGTSTLLLALLTTLYLTIVCSWCIIAVNILVIGVASSFFRFYKEKYKNSEISTDEFESKKNYLRLSFKLLINYPLAAFSVYLLATNFIANGLTVGGVILGSLLTLIVIDVLAPIFSKGCKIYTEKHVKDLLEEDPKDRVQKETDLLKWYDPRLLLMPIIMPIVKKCFSEVASELSERNLDEVNTNLSDVNHEQPKGVQLTQQGAEGFGIA